MDGESGFSPYIAKENEAMTTLCLVSDQFYFTIIYLKVFKLGVQAGSKCGTLGTVQEQTLDTDNRHVCRGVVHWMGG